MGVVMKFGGTSVGSIDKINSIATYIKQRSTKEDIVVVVSAMGKSTDHLIQMAKQITSDLDKREIDTLLSTGEQQTIALLTIALKANQVDAISLTGQQAGFITTSSHTKGIIKDIDISRVQRHIDEQKVVVVAGFQGVNRHGDITTLGRGGSDTSAVALAAKLGYKCEIYTDVDGIYTVDPRVYKNAQKLDYISYEEIMEMAALGAGVIETRSVELASKYNVPLYIAKSLSKEGSGTYIMRTTNLFEEKPITGISITENVAMVTLEQPVADVQKVSNVFQLISKNNISLDMISQNIDEHNQLVLSFSIDMDDLNTIKQLLQENDMFSNVQLSYSTDLVKLSLVGVGMASNFGVASKVFTALTEKNIPYYTISTSEISISFTTDKQYKDEATTSLAERFHL